MTATQAPPSSGPRHGELVRAAFTRYAGQDLLLAPDRRMSYREAWPLVDRIASALGAVGERGCVALMLPNCGGYVLGLLGVAVADWVRSAIGTRDPVSMRLEKMSAVRCSALLTNDEALAEIGGLEALRKHTEVRRVLLLEDDGLPRAVTQLEIDRPEPRADQYPGDVSHLSFTGGTTGSPKAAVLTLSGVRALMAHLWSEVTDVRPGDAFAAVTPFSHASSTFVLPWVLRGGALAWMPKFHPGDLLASIDSGHLAGRRVTTFLVPTALSALADAAGEDGHSRRDNRFHRIVFGGAPTEPTLLRKANRAFPEALVQIFGQTECPMVISTARAAEILEAGTGRGVCVGWPAPLVEVSIRSSEDRPVPDGEIGEICVRADHVMTGYRDNEAESAAKLREGRLHTSDLGYRDDRGRLWVVGRNRDMLISGGYNVYPEEIERRLHPVLGPSGVRQVVVAGLPDTRWGEMVVAGAVLEPGAVPDEALARVRQSAGEVLADYERPKVWLQIDQITLTTLGKPDRTAFREHARSVIRTDPDDRNGVGPAAAGGTAEREGKADR